MSQTSYCAPRAPRVINVQKTGVKGEILCLLDRHPRIWSLLHPHLAHLKLLVRMTLESDWLETEGAIVYKSVGDTADEVAVTTQATRKREQALEEAGFTERYKSANGKCFSKRDRQDQLLCAFGTKR